MTHAACASRKCALLRALICVSLRIRVEGSETGITLLFWMPPAGIAACQTSRMMHAACASRKCALFRVLHCTSLPKLYQRSRECDRDPFAILDAPRRDRCVSDPAYDARRMRQQDVCPVVCSAFAVTAMNRSERESSARGPLCHSGPAQGSQRVKILRSCNAPCGCCILLLVLHQTYGLHLLQTLTAVSKCCAADLDQTLDLTSCGVMQTGADRRSMLASVDEEQPGQNSAAPAAAQCVLSCSVYVQS